MGTKLWILRVYRVGWSRRVVIPSVVWRVWGDPDYVEVVYDEDRDELIVRRFKK